MRNPERIDIFTQKLNQLWKLDSDLRFMQIVSVLVDRMDRGDGFYVEEDEWIKLIDELININIKRRIEHVKSTQATEGLSLVDMTIEFGKKDEE